MNGLTWLVFGMPWLVAPQQQIDCTWLTVDTTAKTATFQLIAGLNGGTNFNGFRNGALTFSVPLNWKVLIAVRSQDTVGHSVAVIDSVKPMPTGGVAAAFVGAITAAASDTLRFVASKTGSYLIVGRTPGQGPPSMWMRFKVSTAERRPFLVATTR